MKNPRKASEWTTREIESDSAGYLAAQKAEREDAGKAAERKAAADEQRRYEAAYVQAGGSKSEAAEAYRHHKDEGAREQAAVADEQGRRVTHHENLRRV